MGGGESNKKERIRKMICLFLFFLFLRCFSPEAASQATAENLVTIALFILCDIELFKLVSGKR